MTGDHLTGDALREYLRGSVALKADAASRGISETEALERLVEISERANVDDATTDASPKGDGNGRK